MKTKTRSIIVATLVAAGCTMLLFLWWSRPADDARPSIDLAGSKDDPAASQPGSAEPQSNSSPLPAQTQTVVAEGVPAPPPDEAAFHKLFAEGTAAYLAQNVRPISFYGLVVDETNAPVAAADVVFTEIYSGQPAPMKTDTTGHFALSGGSGRYMGIEVSKPGYYGTKTSRQSFDYSPLGGNFQPDASNPIVFELRKRGMGVELVTSQYGVNSHLGVSAPKDGTPVWLDFFNRKVGDVGQMQISKLTPVWDRTDRRPHEWRLTLSIPDGGFVELTDDEFPFSPPEMGYRPVLDFHYQPTDTNWNDTIKGQYYIAFGKPRRYGRVKIEAWSLGGVRLEYVVNPDGRPYLEPKEVIIE